MNIPSLYLIRNFTPLHPGSGDDSFGVIDKLVQRDATTNLPCIHASGIKGALKQALNGIWKEEQKKLIKPIFGSEADVNKGGKEHKAQQGQVSFHDAYLLALPVPSDLKPYFLTICPAQASDLLRNLTYLGLKLPDDQQKLLELISEQEVSNDQALLFTSAPVDQSKTLGNQFIHFKRLEGALDRKEHRDTLKDLMEEFTDLIDLVSDETFLELCDDLNLPVIARNALDDGESVNLWYEQIIPREARFFAAIIWDKEENEKQVNAVFEKHPIQLGANASVGQGFTKFYKKA
jgi:CRISPR-associated protein Cmr4